MNQMRATAGNSHDMGAMTPVTSDSATIVGDDSEVATDSHPPLVSVSNLVKHFTRDRSGDLVTAVDGVSIDVRRGEFTVLLGPSGCGKTTLLRCIAGLERPESGRIEILGRTVFDGRQRINVRTERRGLNMIFQSYALWPHMTAAANVAYPLRCRKFPKQEVNERVQQALESVGIGDLGQQYPAQMSGGQQQRVALARAIVTNSELVLFDEPLSNVDAKVREQLRFELMSMQHDLGFSALYVTHDQTEAMELATSIVVLEKGKIAQHGTPQDIYLRPRSRYVAGFIGTINELSGVVESVDAGVATVSTDVGPLRARSMAPGVDAGAEVSVVFRPEHTVLQLPDAPAGENVWQGTVRTSFFSGSHTEVVVDGGDSVFRVWSGAVDHLAPGDPVSVHVNAAHLRVIGT